MKKVIIKIIFGVLINICAKGRWLIKFGSAVKYHRSPDIIGFIIKAFPNSEISADIIGMRIIRIHTTTAYIGANRFV